MAEYDTIPIHEIDIDPMTMPVCPLCDNGIEYTDPVAIVSARGMALGLAHNFCVEEFEPMTPTTHTESDKG